jgi:hypothetical protein
VTNATAPHHWASLASVLVGIIGLQWWLLPETYPFGPGDESGDLSFLSHLESGPAGALAALLGVAGVMTARALSRPYGPVARTVALAAAGVQVVVLGYVVPDITALMFVAYVLALIGPVALLVLAGYHGLRRWPVGTPLALAVVAAAAVGSGIASPAAVADLAREMGGGFEKVGARPLYVLGALATGALWAAVIVRTVGDGRERCAECGRVVWGRGTRSAWAASWVRIVTWAAALCPVPYAALRLTWLTPWPVGISHEELVESPGIRLFGLLLGAAAIGGCLLTLGLTYRWGEVFPGWVPWLRGRPVPITAAVGPALVVAAALTVGGHSIVQAAMAEADGWWEAIGLLLIFPLPVWGPLLGVAAIGYSRRRRDKCDNHRDLGSTLSGVPTTEGGAGHAEGFGAFDPRRRVARRPADGSRPGARLRSRRRGVPGV